MDCPRCHGLMVVDACLNLDGGGKTIWVYEWRCLNCGELLDERTLENRNRSRRRKIAASVGSP